DRLLVEAQASINTAVSDRLAAQANLDDAEAGPRSDELEAEQAKVSAQEAAVKAQAAAVQAEEAAVAQALLALQRTRIIATAPGIVNDKLVNVGDYVRSADPVLELIDNSAIDILLELPEARAAQIEPGQPVVLRSRALPGWEARTAIDSLTPIASATSRSRAARIRLTDPPPGLLPGTALVAALEISGSSSGYQVSRDVLTRRDGQWLVYGIQAGGPEQPSLAQEIPVNLVSDNGETVIIDSPELSPNFEIVLKGGDALQDQAPVMVVEGPSAQPRPGTASDGEAQGGEGAQGGGADGGAQDGEEAQDGASLLPGLSVALPWSIAAQEA
ncbi:MAG: efflux RND transporter periplasmic adaptor subunit, partial [Synechococcales cyanobacterium RM1_1_8]|nr:efflux RND transporter periplasmic adaptor subunit [Synechococcales cyanobacterium RM1_1_8]